MNVKYFLLIGILFLLTLSCVSAEKGNFTELQDNIDASNNTLELTKDYYQHAGDYSNTVKVSNLTVNGNNHTIGSGWGSFINVSEDVEFNDIVFMCSDLMIVGDCNSLIINNCTFENNQNGLYMNVSANNIVIKNSRFTSDSYFDYYDFCNITAKSATIVNTSFVSKELSHCRALDLTSDEFKIINSTFIYLTNDRGAAIYSKKGKGSIINSKFYNNKAYWGSAIYASSSIEISGCEFINNTFKSDYYSVDDACGGALYLNGADNFIHDSKFISNRGIYHGGAIRVIGDKTVIGNCYFEDNDGWNGIIYWQGSNGAIQDSTFVNNHGFAISWIGSDGKIINSSFTETDAQYNGDPVIEWTGVNGLISKSKFMIDNLISVNWDAVNGQIDNCEFIKNKLWSVVWYGKDGKLSNSKFTECSDCVGWEGANGVIDNCIFEKNTVQAVQLNGANAKVLNSKFNNNDVFSNVLECNGKNCLVDKCEFISNKAQQYGAIRWNVNNGKIQNSVFKYNTAKWGDGAIAIGSSYKNILKNNVHVKNTPIEFDVSCSIPHNIYYASGQVASFKLVEKSSLKPMKNIKVSVYIYDGSSWQEHYTLKTDSNGIAKLKLSNLKRFGHIYMEYSFKVPSSLWGHDEDKDISKYSYITSDSNEDYSGFNMKPGKCIVNAPKLTVKHHKSKYFKITVKNKFTKKAVKNLKLKLKIFTGKKSVDYTVKTNKNGVAKFNTKNLSKGTHKVVVKSKNRNYSIYVKSKIKIK